MIGTIKRKMGETAYRLKFRKEIQTINNDLLKITYEETKREIERRQKNG